MVEAIQTLIHSDHMDSMHRPDIICIVAGVGILLNGVCTLLIGGKHLLDQEVRRALG